MIGNNYGIGRNLNEALFIAVLFGIVILEFQAHVFERAIGLYLKWQNHSRPQLGRMWDRDRQNIVAQHKIQSILSIQDLQEQSTESIESIGQLLDNLGPRSSLVVSREKFLSLYYDYPGQWSSRMVSPLDLMKIDAGNDWERVLFIRFEDGITLSFINQDNIPITQIHHSMEELNEIQTTRTIQKGKLEELGIDSQWIFPFMEFLDVLRMLDPASRKALFPDPQWFLEKKYHVTRVGFLETPSREETGRLATFAIEYNTDYYPNVLLIPVSPEVANNVLSQIEKNDLENVENQPGADTELREIIN